MKKNNLLEKDEIESILNDYDLIIPNFGTSLLENVYEDYDDNNISESIFLEILNTIDEYLKNRQESGKNIDFNELVQYLNALISFK